MPPNIGPARPGRVPTPQEAAEYQLTPLEKATVRSSTGSHIVGSPATVTEGLDHRSTQEIAAQLHEIGRFRLLRQHESALSHGIQQRSNALDRVGCAGRQVD